MKKTVIDHMLATLLRDATDPEEKFAVSIVFNAPLSRELCHELEETYGIAAGVGTELTGAQLTKEQVKALSERDEVQQIKLTEVAKLGWFRLDGNSPDYSPGR